ncbi:hypothetical protein [Arthrobacter bambusae]|uniref:hypothetical protein n=1 Tax=Arthrobacter bambusae TaxID=1338426 RepID=UPI0027838751|nr:hypothetical protein [Arthrobacter bambusae]MDQ0030338.1 hypothetical protein [Arthrobacter bambusae]MDQ0098020.1 hypothetical protein [Arthrobacter bambusae]
MPQWVIILLELSPLVLGGVLAVGAWLGTRRHGTSLSGRAGVLAAVGGLVPMVVSCLYSIVGVTPQLLTAIGPDAGMGVLEVRFVTPLAAGLVALVMLCVRGRRKPSTATAGIARRTAFTFLSAGWTVAVVAIVVVTIGLSLAAGLASVPDRVGNYTVLTFQIGTMRVGTTIYGWYYSVPTMFLLMALIGTAWSEPQHRRAHHGRYRLPPRRDPRLTRRHLQNGRRTLHRQRRSNQRGVPVPAGA